ncbi:MAG: hypothetical protein NDI88_07995 [Lysobacter sp.]|nr:hypothetical protein [Lysobacter sp.]
MTTITNKELDKEIAREENRDPISGAPGAHPVGTGVGAALGGAAAGAAAGTVVGPVGTVVGAAVGAIVGGLAGKGVAESIDPTRELVYWRESYKTRPYADGSTNFDEYEPAYGYGVAAYTKYPDRSFDDLDPELSRGWIASRGKSTLAWDRARFAARDAWDRVSSTPR